MKTITKVFLFGCGGIAALTAVGIAVAGVWLLSLPESGVKLGNEMHQYASDYIARHGLLRPGEEIVAYYDETLSMDGTEAAILTLDRVMYHKNGNTTSIPITEIEAIRHRYESLVGDIFEIQSTSGRTMKIEIAPYNQGETFKDVLMSIWEKEKDNAPDGQQPAPADGAPDRDGSGL